MNSAGATKASNFVDLPDEAWLRSVATFGELNARHPVHVDRASGVATVAAIILFQRDL